MKVAILGTGPSGLYLASLLSDRGDEVRVFDPKTPWEHPSGEHLLTKDLRSLKYFEEGCAYSTFKEFLFLSPKGTEYRIPLTSPHEVIACWELENFLMSKIKEKEVFLVPSRLEEVERKEGKWFLKTQEGRWEADFLVGADGARSFLRRALGLEKGSREMTLEVSFSLPQKLGETAMIRFLGDMPGYFWASPRSQGSSVGLWASARFLQAMALFEKLEVMIQNLLQIPLPQGAIRSIANLPLFQKFLPAEIAGEGWAFVGGGADLVDPITADGMLDGLRSSEILADLLGSDGEVTEREITRLYPDRLKKEIVPLLQKKARLRGFFYQRFALEWMIRRASTNPGVSRFLKTSFLRS